MGSRQAGLAPKADARSCGLSTGPRQPEAMAGPSPSLPPALRGPSWHRRGPSQPPIWIHGAPIGQGQDQTASMWVEGTEEDPGTRGLGTGQSSDV